MFDPKLSLSEEVRHAAFRRSPDPKTWQDVTRQPRGDDLETGLDEVGNKSWLSGLLETLQSPNHHERRNGHLSPANQARIHSQVVALKPHLKSHS